MTRWQEYGNLGVPADSLTKTDINMLRTVGWKGGWQPDLATAHVGLDQLVDITNYIWKEGYSLERRGGVERVTTSVVGLEKGQQSHIRSVTVAASLASQPSQTQEVLYYNEDDGEVWYNTLGELLEEERDGTGSDLAYSGQSIGSWSSTTTNYFRTYNLNSVVFEEFVYITGLRFKGYSGVSTIETHNGMAAGASKPIRYDVLNDTWTRPLPHPLAGETSGFVTARCALAEYDRLFVANCYSQGVYRYPSRIYWTDAGTAETFQSNSFIDVGVDDGSEITALVTTGDSIIIFKDHQTYMLQGTDEDTFSLHSINPRLGVKSSNAAIEHRGSIYFFDDTEGLMKYDGANFTNVSVLINDEMLNNSSYNREADFRVNVTVLGDQIFVSIPQGTDQTDFPTITFVYDTHLEVWTKHDIGIPDELNTYQTDHTLTGVQLHGVGEAYFTSPSDEIGIFRWNSSQSEDEFVAGDATVAASIVTGWTTPQEMGNRHRIRRLDILTGATSESDVDVTLYRDFNNTNAWQTATFDPDGNLTAWHEQDQGYDIKSMFTWLQIKLIQNQGTDLNANLLGYQMSISSREWKRGVQGGLNIAPV